MILIVRSYVVELIDLCIFSLLIDASKGDRIDSLIVTCDGGFFTRSLLNLC